MRIEVLAPQIDGAVVVIEKRHIVALEKPRDHFNVGRSSPANERQSFECYPLNRAAKFATLAGTPASDSKPVKKSKQDFRAHCVHPCVAQRRRFSLWEIRELIELLGLSSITSRKQESPCD